MKRSGRGSRAAGLALLLLSLSACSSIPLGPPLYFYQNFNFTPPKGATVTICHGYTCRYSSAYTFNAGELAQFRKLMRSGAKSPKAEREAVADVIAYAERRVGAKLGTSADTGKNTLEGVSDPTQMDCIDEATNTTSVLLVLADHGLLKHHTVRKPQIRGYMIDLRWPHWTGVLVETKSGTEWAVDSWFRDNGVKPVVIPLEDWYQFDEDPAKTRQLARAQSTQG